MNWQRKLRALFILSQVEPPVPWEGPWKLLFALLPPPCSPANLCSEDHGGQKWGLEAFPYMDAGPSPATSLPLVYYLVDLFQ